MLMNVSGTSVIHRTHARYIDRVFTQPFILIQRFETTFCFDGEPNRLTGLHGQNFAFIHDDGAVDDYVGNTDRRQC